MRLRIRKSLGRAKFLVIDKWPHLPKQFRANAMRAKLRHRIADLPVLVPTMEETAPEFHMLCCKRDVDMGIWASWSIMRFLPSAKLYVHSDGTLDEGDCKSWKAVVENVLFTHKEERDERASQVLGNRYPTLANWRNQHLYSAKLIDFHLFGESKKIICLDSDVLCFREPTEVIDSLHDPSLAFRWHQDVQSSYPTDPSTLSKIFGQAMKDRVCAGFLITKRWGPSDFAFFDQAITLFRENNIDPFHFWAEQAMYALSAARHSAASPLSKAYAINRGPTSKNSVLRHYVSGLRSRPYFFLDGVPRLLSQVGLPEG